MDQRIILSVINRSAHYWKCPLECELVFLFLAILAEVGTRVVGGVGAEWVAEFVAAFVFVWEWLQFDIIVVWVLKLTRVLHADLNFSQISFNLVPGIRLSSKLTQLIHQIDILLTAHIHPRTSLQTLNNILQVINLASKLRNGILSLVVKAEVFFYMGVRSAADGDECCVEE